LGRLANDCLHAQTPVPETGDRRVIRFRIRLEA
jgi:hypothetical protein